MTPAERPIRPCSARRAVRVAVYLALLVTVTATVWVWTRPPETVPLAELFRGTDYAKFAPVNYKADWADIRRADEAVAGWDARPAGK